jgi:hypothetical protein
MSRDELRAKLEAGGYGGLVDTNEGCGCDLDDLCACGSYDEESPCEPGYKFACVGSECAHPCDACPDGGYCITISKTGPPRKPKEEPMPDAPELPEVASDNARAEYDRAMDDQEHHYSDFQMWEKAQAAVLESKAALAAYAKQVEELQLQFVEERTRWAKARADAVNFSLEVDDLKATVAEQAREIVLLPTWTLVNTLKEENERLRLGCKICAAHQQEKP